jgi:hypothetical protein
MKSLNDKLIDNEQSDTISEKHTEKTAITDHQRNKTHRYWSWLSGVIAHYDLCMVFPLDEATSSLTTFCVHFLEHLSHLGIDFFLCYGLQKDCIYVLLRAKLDRLRVFAADIEYQMLLDAGKLQEIAERGDLERGISPLRISHIPQETTLRPYDYIYAPYRLEVDESLYWRPPPEEGHEEGLQSHPFRDLVRLKLTEMMVETSTGINVDEEADVQDVGKVNIRKHLDKGNILAYFPLHRQEKLDMFAEHWLPWEVLPWKAPLFEIKVSREFLPVCLPACLHFCTSAFP